MARLTGFASPLSAVEEAATHAVTDSTYFSLDVLQVLPSIAIGAFANVHLCDYRGELTLEALEAANQHHRNLMTRFPRTFVLGQARPNLPLPVSQVRQRAAVLIEENRTHVEGSALVVDGTGFWASAARSVMTASFAIARQPYPSKCFATGVEAGTWLATLPAGHGLGPAQVASALAQLSAAA